jgi:serine/threonine protein kinase
MEKPCPEGKIRNPITGRCVNCDGKIGKKICKNRITVNFNNQVIQIPSNRDIPANENVKSCPDGKIRNPKTGRCVNANGKIAKLLFVNNNDIVHENRNVENCPPGKIRNPKNGRCVNVNGKVGKEILRDMNRVTPSPNRITNPRFSEYGLNPDFRMVKKIGEGGFGKVYLFENSRDKKKYVFKVGNKHHMNYQYNMLKSLEDNNIVNYLHPKNYRNINSTKSGFMMDFLNRYVTLSDFIKELEKKNIVLSIDNYNHIYNSVNHDLMKMHQHNYVHTDIKPDNIMIRYKKNTNKSVTIKNVKIIDFGVVIHVNDNNKRYKFKGFTFKFLDTKTLTPNVANVKSSDIWKRTFSPKQLKENDLFAFQKTMDKLKKHLSISSKILRYFHSGR